MYKDAKPGLPGYYSDWLEIIWALKSSAKEKGPRNEPLTLDIVFFIKWPATAWIKDFKNGVRLYLLAKTVPLIVFLLDSGI